MLDDGEDFNSTNTTIIFPSGASTQNGDAGCISIDINDDNIYEGSQFFMVEIMSIYPQIATGTGLNVSVEIIDNDGKRLISNIHTIPNIEIQKYDCFIKSDCLEFGIALYYFQLYFQGNILAY